MSREEEDERGFSNSMEPDRSMSKPVKLPPEVREELQGAMSRLETMMTLEEDSIQSLKELLFNEQLPSYKAAISLIESTGELIEPLFSTEEDGLSEKRSRFLSRVGDLARTFYHSSITTYLRMGSVASSVFAEEFNRAYWKGISLRKTILEDLKTMIDGLKPFFETVEKLRLYQGMFAFAFNPNFTTAIQQLARNVQAKITSGNEETFEHTCYLIEQFIPLFNKWISLLRALQGASIDPLIDVILAESKGVEKVFDVVQRFSDLKARKIKETELGQTCDVISWGLDDKTSVDDLLDAGREYLAEISQYKERLDRVFWEIYDFFHP